MRRGRLIGITALVAGILVISTPEGASSESASVARSAADAVARVRADRLSRPGATGVAWDVSRPMVRSDPPDTLWIFSADFEDELGDNAGWTSYDNSVAQTGVVFRRGQYGIDFARLRTLFCEDRPTGAYAYAAMDPIASTMVDSQDSVLRSPWVTTAGAEYLVVRFDMWIDCPRDAFDLYDIWWINSEGEKGRGTGLGRAPGRYEGEGWYGGPSWVHWEDDWSSALTTDSLQIYWRLWDEEQYLDRHWAGLILNTARVGALVYDDATDWYSERSGRFRDWFNHQLTAGEAYADTARVRIRDVNGVATAWLEASNDGGTTWHAYPMTHEAPSDWWRADAPAELMTAGSVIAYRFGMTDGLGATSRYPDEGAEFEFSILPVNGGILFVDKHNDLTVDENGEYRYETEFYYREALDILGHDYDVFDVRDASGDPVDADGPDYFGLENYETVIWSTGDLDLNTVTFNDQVALETWLPDAEGLTVNRNLLLTGNGIGYELETFGPDVVCFYNCWLFSIHNGTMNPEQPGWGLYDSAGGDTFLTWPCRVHDGCPDLARFDKMYTEPSATCEHVAEYGSGELAYGAGVAYTHPDLHYKTVNLGFGIEYLTANVGPSRDHGNGVVHRVDLLSNILEFFEVEPGGQPTEVTTGEHVTALMPPTPNPSRGQTRVSYSIGQGGPVKIEVYDVAGRRVRTLVDDVAVGRSSDVAEWDGRDDTGRACANGVYFVRLLAPEFEATRKLVVLR